MIKLLLPIDGSARSVKAAEQVRILYKKEDVEVILMTVCGDCGFVNDQPELDRIRVGTSGIFKRAEDILEGYRIKKIVDFGHIGNTILKHIEDEKAAAVIMTRSTREGHFKHLGSVTSHVVKYARCLIIIVPEVQQYVFDTNAAQVSLSGQLCKGADSCLLPSAAGTCSYEIEVLKGKVRLNHMAYNPDGASWTLEPGNHQKAHYDINEGEAVKIRLFVGVSFGEEDRIDIVNLRHFDPAVLKYKYMEE